MLFVDDQLAALEILVAGFGHRLGAGNGFEANFTTIECLSQRPRSFCLHYLVRIRTTSGV